MPVFVLVTRRAGPHSSSFVVGRPHRITNGSIGYPELVIVSFDIAGVGWINSAHLVTGLRWLLSLVDELDGIWVWLLFPVLGVVIFRYLLEGVKVGRVRFEELLISVPRDIARGSTHCI